MAGICRDGIWLSHTALLGDRADIDDVVAGVRKVRERANDLIATAAK